MKAPSDRVERILCASIWVDDGISHVEEGQRVPTGVLFCGYRHGDCFMAMDLVYPNVRDILGTPTAWADQLSGKNAGFLTSRGRHVDREEAGQIAYAAGQTDRLCSRLTSEDLY